MVKRDRVASVRLPLPRRRSSYTQPRLALASPAWVTDVSRPAAS
jgi:hypothetical protein